MRMKLADSRSIFPASLCAYYTIYTWVSSHCLYCWWKNITRVSSKCLKCGIVTGRNRGLLEMPFSFISSPYNKRATRYLLAHPFIREFIHCFQRDMNTEVRLGSLAHNHETRLCLSLLLCIARSQKWWFLTAKWCTVRSSVGGFPLAQERSKWAWKSEDGDKCSGLETRALIPMAINVWDLCFSNC